MWRKSATSRFRDKANKEKGGIPCPICNYHCLSIGSHMFYAHNKKADVYRKESGLNLNHRLTSDELNKFYISHAKKTRTEKIIIFMKKLGKSNKGKSKKGLYVSEENKKAMSERGKKYKHFLLLTPFKKEKY